MDVADGRFHAWIERDSGPRRNQSRFAGSDCDRRSTTGTVANGFRTIAVGAYDPHEARRPIAPSSSCGPTLDGRIKPDYVAPGSASFAPAPRRATARARSSQRPAPAWPRLMPRVESPHVSSGPATSRDRGDPRDPGDDRREASGTRRHAQRLGYLNIARAVEMARSERLGRASHSRRSYSV